MGGRGLSILQCYLMAFLHPDECRCTEVSDRQALSYTIMGNASEGSLLNVMCLLQIFCVRCNVSADEKSSRLLNKL